MSFLPLTELTPTFKVAIVEVDGINGVDELISVLPIDDTIISMVYGDIQRGIPQKKHFKHNLTIRLAFRGMNVVVRIKNKFHITGIKTTRDAIDVTHHIIDAIEEARGDEPWVITGVTDVMQNYIFRLPKPIDVHIFPEMVPDIFTVCRSWSSKEKMTLKYEIEEGRNATFTVSASGSVTLSGKSEKLMIPAYDAFVRMYMKIKDEVSIDREIKIKLNSTSSGASKLPKLADEYMKALLDG